MEEKSPKNLPNGFSFRYWSAPFYHDLAAPRPYTFLRVYETHKSKSCYRVTSGCEQRGSEAGWCNWSFQDGSLLSYVITRIPLHFQAASKRANNTDKRVRADWLNWNSHSHIQGNMESLCSRLPIWIKLIIWFQKIRLTTKQQDTRHSQRFHNWLILQSVPFLQLLIN